MKRARTFEEIERQVLAAVFLRPRALELAAELEIDDFGAFEHQEIFTALRNVQARKQPITIDTVAEEMLKRARLRHLGREQPVNEATPFFLLGNLVAEALPYGKDDADIEAELPRHLRELRVVSDQRNAIRNAR